MSEWKAKWENAPAAAAAETVEEKVYVTPDASKSKDYDSYDDFLQAVCTPEEIARIKALKAAHTIGCELTSMRIRGGISQKVMAAAMGVSQPRISAIETAPNSKASLEAIQKYVDVTGFPFKARLENGSTLSIEPSKAARPRPRRRKAAVAAGA